MSKERLEDLLLALSRLEGTNVASAVRRSVFAPVGFDFAYDSPASPWFEFATLSINDPTYLNCAKAPGLIVLWDLGREDNNRLRGNSASKHSHLEAPMQFYFDLTDLVVGQQDPIMFFFSRANSLGAGITHFEKPRFDLVHIGFPFDFIEAAAALAYLFEQRKIMIKNDWFLTDRIPKMGGDPADESFRGLRRAHAGAGNPSD